MLADPLRHGALRIAAAELGRLTARQPRDAAADRLRGAVSPRLLIVRGPTDLPEAARRMAAMLHARGPQVAMRDVTVVAATLTRGATYAGGMLHAAGRAGNQPELLQAGQALLDLRQPLAALNGARVGVATLTRPSPGLAAQCAEMLARLRRMHEDGEQLDWTRGRTWFAGAAGHLVAWAEELPIVGQELHRSIAAAATTRALMVPNELDGRAPFNCLWRPVRPDDRPRMLDRAHSLCAAAGRPPGPLGRASEALGLRDPRESAEERASGAAAELRRIVSRREHAGADELVLAAHPRTVRHTRTER